MIGRGMVDWSRGMIRSWGIGVDGSAFVGNLGDVAAVVVGCVANCLHSAVREGHGVGAWMDQSIGCQRHQHHHQFDL